MLRPTQWIISTTTRNSDAYGPIALGATGMTVALVPRCPQWPPWRIVLNPVGVGAFQTWVHTAVRMVHPWAEPQPYSASNALAILCPATIIVDTSALPNPVPKLPLPLPAVPHTRPQRRWARAIPWGADLVLLWGRREDWDACADDWGHQPTRRWLGASAHAALVGVCGPT